MDKDIFKDILLLHDVAAAALLDDNDRLIVSAVGASGAGIKGFDGWDWPALTRVFKGFKETEIVYENYHIFIKKAPGASIAVVMGRFAPVSMVRLSCDVVLARQATPQPRPKGLAGFFRKK